MNLWLIPIFPLLGFLANGLFGRRIPKALINTFAVGSVALSFAWVVKTLLGLSPIETKYVEHYFTWIQSGTLNIGVDFAVDRLTAIMLMVVTGVGTLIHIYAVGYMEHEGGYYRFFAYLNLFMFFMLVLVLAQNYLLLFVGWEGVGLCSYLLIGFYFTEQFATTAGNKAFIVNRIGDFGFSLAMFLIFRQFGSLDFSKVFDAAKGMPVEAGAGILTTITLLLLVGATGKSAQIPLYVWLPDAMAGPTPVSALIHAATMVTAGVYMIGALGHVVHESSDHHGHGCGDRPGHRVLRRHHRHDADGHQESVRVLHRFAARLHVSGRWRGRVFGRHLPPDDARILQSPAVPGRGRGDSRPARRAGFAPDGRPLQTHEDHGDHAVLRLACHLGLSVAPPDSSVRTLFWWPLTRARRGCIGSA